MRATSVRAVPSETSTGERTGDDPATRLRDTAMQRMRAARPQPRAGDDAREASAPPGAGTDDEPPGDGGPAGQLVAAYRRTLAGEPPGVPETGGSLVGVWSSGSLVYDRGGVPYLGCGGFGGYTLGYRHPRVVEAVGRSRTAPPRHRGVRCGDESARTLLEVCPSALSHVRFTSGGAEAVAAALELARRSGREHVISTSWRDRAPGDDAPGRPAEWEQVAFGDARVLATRLAALGPRRATVLVQPARATAGVAVPPPGYLRAVRRACDAHGALLVLDEIRTGLGRLGYWWGCESEDLTPDILLAGKALGGGVLPVAAMISTRKLAGLTGGGRAPRVSGPLASDPMAMAAVTATIAAIRDEDVIARAARLGVRLLSDIRRTMIRTLPGAVREIRGRGLLIGLEFLRQDIARAFAGRLLRERVVAHYSGGARPTVRFTPPATLSDPEYRWLLRAVEVAARSVHALAVPAAR